MDLKQPDTVLNIYEDVPIANGQQIAFRSLASQAAYFNERRIRQVTAMTNIRHNRGEVKISGSPASVVNASYLSFNNQSFEGKTFYAAILDFEYVNNDTVRLFFEIDYWQTFMFDVKWRSSRIDREHLSEIGWNSAVANPYRNDIPELMTDEGMRTGVEYEVDYQQHRGIITESGKPALSPEGIAELEPAFRDDFTPVEPVGTPNLASQFGTTFSQDYESGVSAVILQIASSEWLTERLQGDWLTNGLFHEAFTNRDPGIDSYANGFGRGYSLVVVSHSDEASGTNVGISQNVKTILDDLTANGLTSSVLGLWAVPGALFMHDLHFAVSEGNPFWDPQDPRRIRATIPRYTIEPIDYDDIPGYPEIVNPKLRRFPFRYIRMVSPSGEEQGYEIERFADPEACNVRMYGLLDDAPSLTVAPEQYNGRSLDYQKRLVHNTFPQMGFVTDSFLTYLASQHQQAMVNTTRGQGQAFNNPAAGIEEGFSWLGNAGKALLQGDVSGAVAATYDTGRDREIYQQAQAAGSLGAKDWGSVRSGDVSAGPFNHQRDAFTADIYHAGNAAGSLAHRLEQNFFEAVQVTLRGELLKLYDDYLTCYGYSSTRLGVPRVAEWVQGGTDSTHFVSHDGMSFTYVKTESAKVFGAFKPACDAIASLFDGGVRMINGEAS